VHNRRKCFYSTQMHCAGFRVLDFRDFLMKEDARARSGHRIGFSASRNVYCGHPEMQQQHAWQAQACTVPSRALLHRQISDKQLQDALKGMISPYQGLHALSVTKRLCTMVWQQVVTLFCSSCACQ
jgi:hypothetical protein